MDRFSKIVKIIWNFKNITGLNKALQGKSQSLFSLKAE